MTTTLEKIKALEAEIQEKTRALESIKKADRKFRVGQRVEIQCDYEWVCSKGTVLVVREVFPTHLWCVYEDPKLGGVFYISFQDAIPTDE